MPKTRCKQVYVLNRILSVMGTRPISVVKGSGKALSGAIGDFIDDGPP